MGSIANLGLDSAMERYVAVLVRRGDTAGIWGTLQIGIGISAATSILTGAAFFAFAEPIAVRIFHEPRLVTMLQLFAFIIPLLTVSNLVAAAARGFKRMDYSALAKDFTQPLVTMVLIAILSLLGLDAFTAGLAFGIADLTGAVLIFYLVHRQFSLRRPLRQADRDFRNVLAFALPFWLSGLLTKLRKNVQTVVLGTLTTIANVGIFSLMTSANMVGRVANLAISTSARPIFAELQDGGDRDRVGRLYATTSRWTLTLNFPIFLVMVLYPEPILAIFGEDFAAGSAAFAVLAWAELANAATGTCGSVLDMTGYHKLKVVNSVLWIALLIAANVVFVPAMGVMGAAIAVLIGTAAVNLIRLAEVRILLGLQPYRLEMLRSVVAAAGAYAIGTALDLAIPATGGLQYLLLDASIVGLSYLGLLVLLGVSQEDRFVLQRVIGKARLALAGSRA